MADSNVGVLDAKGNQATKRTTWIELDKMLSSNREIRTYPATAAKPNQYAMRRPISCFVYHSAGSSPQTGNATP